MLRLVLVAAIVGPWLVISPVRTVACSCGDREPLSEALARSDLVFQGIAMEDFLDREEDYERYSETGFDEIEFEVLTVWKGKAPSRIVVKTFDLEACGYEFAKGVEYVVFASDEWGADGQCGWTHRVREPGAFAELIAEHQAREAGVNPGSPEGYPNGGTAGLANTCSSKTYLLTGLVVIIAVIGAFTVSRYWLSRHER